MVQNLLPSRLSVLPGQAWQTVSPTPAYFPASQEKHALCPVDPWKVPAGHNEDAVDAMPTEKDPASAALHEDASAREKNPGVQFAHITALGLLYVPGVHAEQFTDIKCENLPLSHDVHDVAAEASPV